MPDPSAGGASELPPAVSEEMRQKLAASEMQFALTFTRVVSVLLRSSHYKHYTLSDLEWLVMPPILTRQCAVLHAEAGGLPVPVAVALWASVSPEVDGRLSQNVARPIRLRPDEWRSGEILWLIDVVGSAEASRQLLSRLQQEVFKGRQVKLRQKNDATGWPSASEGVRS